MKFLFVALLFIPWVTWGQIKHQVKVSRGIPGKSNEEIKELVLYNGAMDAIKNAAPTLGYDYPSFIKKLDEKFNVYFSLYKEQQLVEKFGKNYSATLSKKDKITFLASIEEKKDQLYRKFNKASGTIKSYSVKNGVVELNLDKPKVERLLRRILKDQSKSYSKLWIISEFNLNGFNWDNLELHSAEIFKGPIENSWNNWLNENLPLNVEEAGICRGSCLEVFKNWETKAQDQTAGVGGIEFINGIWGKITFDLKLIPRSNATDGKVFEWQGRLVLLDINTKRLLASLELPLEKKSFQNVSQKKMNSDFASLLYRSGISGFTNLKGALQNQMVLNRVSRLSVFGQKHLLDVQKLLEELKVRGSSLGLEAQIDNFKANEAQILCFYQGEEKSFTDLLSKLKELKLSKSYKTIYEFNGIHHVLKLVND